MINLIKTKSQSDLSNQTSIESSSDDQLLLIEDSSSNESNGTSSQSSYDCVEICLCHIKQVNVITSEQNFLLDLIDKLPNQNLQTEYFKKYLEIQRQNNERSLENTNQYSLKTVLGQLSVLKTIGILELQNGINQIKLQINKIQNQNQEIKTRLQILEHENFQTLEMIEEKILEERESSQLFVHTITRMITQKWHIKVKLFIKPDFSKEFIALVDSRVDINYIQEGLIPTVYFEKNYQGVVSANTKPLQIDYKISKVHICNKNVCFKTSLLFVKEMNKEIILGTLFLALLYLFRVDKEGLKSVYKDQEI